ncbi:DUF6090 family protein [Rasiella sp. SM2506]|uniref:DUF6090 family protein n=1 Tax=Rasiella sp. SM2506 TaxID=3423914 RepID=UPI003D7A878A
MIKFFRHIRQRLVTENKLSKYLLYAIGEIILVVIGILIALSINNWNQDRLNKSEEQNYLKAIKTDLKKDSLNLNHLINNIDIQLTTLGKLKKDLDSESLTIQQNVPFTSSLLNTFSFVPEKSTIQDLVSSGKLNLLANKQVKDTLLSYYNTIDTSIFALNTSLIEYSRNTIAPFLMTYYTLEFNYPESLITENSNLVTLTTEQKQSQFLSNAVKYRIAILSSLKSSYEALIIQINGFQKTLDTKIKK